MMNQPLAVIAQYLGTSNVNVSKFMAGCMLVGIFVIVASIALMLRRRLYLPMSIIVVGMLIYQPYSTIPSTLAATTRAPPTDLPPQSNPTVVFTPLESAATQGLGIALPNAGTFTNAQSTTLAVSRSAGTSSSVDTDGDGLSDSEETNFHSDPNLVDTDSDGLDDKAEYLYNTNPRNSDSDSDNLSDFAEIQIGTSPLHRDSDSDGISDIIEITAVNTYGSLQLYSNPLAKDTNNDGLLDGAECPNRVYSSSTIPTIIPDCIDTDKDNIPDFLDADNDDDGVPDAVDLSSQTFLPLPEPLNAHKLFNENDPYELKVLDIPVSNSVRPVIVDLQFVPINILATGTENKRMLYLDNSIYDWPNNDKLGQVQRTKSTNLRTYTGSTFADERSLQGDMRVSGSLEVRIPVGPNDFGGLPLQQCTETNTCNDTVPRWLNTNKLKDYGISGVYSRNSDNSINVNEVTLTIPISPVLDPTTGSTVAYSSKLYYENNGNNWLNSHRVRLQWVVSSVQDFCPDDKPNCMDAERQESINVIQTYYGNWMLTGATVTDNITPYEMAVVVEDASSAAVSAPTKRRKEIVNAYTKIDEAFISNPIWNVSDTVNKRMSIVQQFDSRTNADVRTNQLGLDLSSFTATYKTYATEAEQSYVFLRDTPQILDSTICRNFAKTSCTTQEIANLKSQCVSVPFQNDIRCMPAVMYVGTNKQRDGELSATGQLAITNQNVTYRSLTSRFFRIDRQPNDATTLTWRSMSIDEISADIDVIAQNATQTSAPVTDPVQANILTTYGGALSTLMVLLIVSDSSIRSFADTEISAARNRSISVFYANPSNTWGDYIHSYLTRYTQLLQLSKKAPAPTSEDLFDKYGTEDWQTIQNAYQATVNNPEIAVPTLLASLSILAASPVLMTLIVAALAGRYGYATVRFVIARPVVLKSVILVINTGKLLYKLFNYLVASLVEAVGAALTGATAASTSMFRSISATWKASGTIGKALTVLGVLVGTLINIFTMVNALEAARFGWEKGNAVASFAGAMAALVILTALSLMGPAGALIAAIIGAIDATIGLICASALTAKQQRSSAGQWLCGGISGLLANMFTWYKSSLVVDPDDQYSHKLEVSPVSSDIGLKNSLKGFTKDNIWKMKLSVVDKIEKMPFPATWMALPWFWQWNRQNERDTDFRYVLNPDKIDLSGQLSIGSQYGSYTRISDPDFSWQLQQYVSYETPLTNTGINQKLADLYLSKAWKAERQTCFAIWIFALFFVYPIPICFIEDQSKTDDLNINESSQSIFDVLPATIDEFAKFRGVEGHRFTFAWASDSNVPAFPAFVDSDNDGLNADVELRLQTSDAQWDDAADSLSDAAESTLGTSPKTSDTDRDGLNDQHELLIGSNPTKLDSDGDGLTDGEEVVHVENGQRVGGWDVAYDIVNDVPLVTWMGSDPTRA
ncbi:MAG: hypothetical protein ACKO83_05745, partial [Roseiflexaceae bacterium]